MTFFDSHNKNTCSMELFREFQDNKGNKGKQVPGVQKLYESISIGEYAF